MKTLISLALLLPLLACSNNEQKFDCAGVGLILTSKGAKFANTDNFVLCKTEGVWNYYGKGNCKNVDSDGLIFDTVTFQIVPIPGAVFIQEPIACKKIS